MPDTNKGIIAMKSILNFLFVIILLVTLSSCSGSKGSKSSFYDYSDSENVENEPKEAEKKPNLFNQHLLEHFCQNYYNNCFSGRDYHYNSLIVDYTEVIDGNWEGNNIVSWNVIVHGKHSFEGSFRNHNDSPFEAFVHDLGDNSYKIEFCIKRYDIFGDQMREQECATRTYSYYE